VSNQTPPDSWPSPVLPDGLAQALDAEGKLAPAAEYIDANTSRPTSLGHRTSVGILWLIVQTLGNRLVGIGSQIVLAWLLRPGDFGLVGMAYTVTSFTGVLVNPGLDQILIHRQRHFRLWANPAFWMSVTFGITATVVLSALAPLAAQFYGEPSLKGLIFVMAGASFFSAVAVVPSTALQAQMRFKLIAIIGMIVNFASAALSIFFAWRGFGAYCFVLPTLILNALMLVFYWVIASAPISLYPQWRRWKFLVSDSVYVIFTRVLQTIVGQGDYITLGYFCGKQVLGVYFFAFNLSTLVFRVLAGNVTNVLFPALSQVQGDFRRQLNAAMKAAVLLTTIATPAGMLQVLLAGPAILLFFHSRWLPAIPLVQLLSLGACVSVAVWPMGSLMSAQGRFKALFWLWLISAVFFAAMIVPLGYYFGATGGAVANLLFYVVAAFLGFGVTVYGIYPWWRLAFVITSPILSTLAAAMLCAAITFGISLWHKPRTGAALELVFMPICFTVAYTLILRWMDKSLFAEVHERFRALWCKKSS